MAILAGIDEAGFGPILGPLVVSSSVFRVPENLALGDLWTHLRRSVADRRCGLGGRLLIADSKKAFSRSLGIGHLRRTVLSTLEYLGSHPRCAEELLSVLCPDCLGHLVGYPWYKRLDGYPLGGDDADVEIAASMLKKDLASRHIELLGLRCRCLEVANYNRLVSATKNKAKVLFAAVAELIQAVMEESKDEDLEIVIDRQGGRSHYRRQLQLMFDGAALRIVREDAQTSSYELTTGNRPFDCAPLDHARDRQGRRVRVHFVVGADSRYLPVSLASMASKYVREVLVGNINRYFTGFNSALRPTAGYWKDGLRFIEDIKTHIPGVSFDANQLIRCR